MDGLKVGTTSFVGQPDAMSEVLDSQLKFTESGTGDWWLATGVDDDYYYEADSAQATGTEGEEACLQAIVDSPNSETLKFYWKVSSEANYDYLQFYIDGTLKDQISGEVAWTQKSYAVSSGIHILKWRFIKNSSGSSGNDYTWAVCEDFSLAKSFQKLYNHEFIIVIPVSCLVFDAGRHKSARMSIGNPGMRIESCLSH